MITYIYIYIYIYTRMIIFEYTFGFGVTVFLSKTREVLPYTKSTILYTFQTSHCRDASRTQAAYALAGCDPLRLRDHGR